MTDAESSIYAAIIGASSAIIGGLVVALFSYFTQTRILAHQFKQELAKDLHAKRLVALQNVIFAIDFLDKSKDHTFTEQANKIWLHLVDNNGCNLAFIPERFRDEFSYLILALYSGTEPEVREQFDYERLNALKDNILKLIDSDFDIRQA